MKRLYVIQILLVKRDYLDVYEHLQYVWYLFGQLTMLVNCQTQKS